jgi:hypothetical protein
MQLRGYLRNGTVHIYPPNPGMRIDPGNLPRVLSLTILELHGGSCIRMLRRVPRATFWHTAINDFAVAHSS